MKVCAVILTKNEALHLLRCIKSIAPLCEKIYVIDSNSDDDTESIARAAGCEFIKHDFVDQATQFNFAIDHVVTDDFKWCLRIDADEYLEDSSEMRDLIELIHCSEVNGVALRRNIVFLNRLLKYGKLGPQRVVRLFRVGFGRSENRSMDEHIVVSGKVINSNLRIIDHCLKGYDFWVQKHLGYARREARLCEREMLVTSGLHYDAAIKRVGKFIFNSIPGPISIPLYFIIRYVFCLGFLDGKSGFIYAFNQIVWYRSVVLMKKHYENN
jgi:glycosyltransferase involved in cell wall biosynthesis